MQSLIHKSFDKMILSYEELLESFYPARDGTGFTEANQVHIYINSLMECLDDPKAVSWLEFPWEDKSQHIDGLVYSPKNNSVFYIEAKRLSVTKKKGEIIRDILRVITSDRSFIEKNNITNVNSEYIIVLSDVWLEDKWKKSMPEWWCGNDNVPSQVKEWEQRHGTQLVNPKSVLADELPMVEWKQSNKFAYWLGEKLMNVPNYCLLMASKKI